MTIILFRIVGLPLSRFRGESGAVLPVAATSPSGFRAYVLAKLCAREAAPTSRVTSDLHMLSVLTVRRLVAWIGAR